MSLVVHIVLLMMLWMSCTSRISVYSKANLQQIEIVEFALERLSLSLLQSQRYMLPGIKTVFVAGFLLRELYYRNSVVSQSRQINDRG